MSVNSDAAVAKLALVTGLVLMIGSSVGIGLTLALANKRRRRERGFTKEDTTALAFQIASLSQQLQNDRASMTAEVNEAIAIMQQQQQLQTVTSIDDDALAQGSGEKTSNHASTARDEAEVPTQVPEGGDLLRNSEEELEGALSMYRKQYQNWRKGQHRGAKTNGPSLGRHARSLTHGDVDLIEGDWLRSPQVGERVTTHMWQQLNMGPSNTQQKRIKIAVIGGGAFGTAMAAAAGRNGHEVIILVRRREVAREIKLTHINADYLPGLTLPPSVSATIDPAECLNGAELVIHALPAQKSPDWIKAHKHLIPADVIYCSTAKGLHLESKGLLSNAMLKAFDRNQPFAVLSGPSFAKEIVSEQPTSVVVAAKQLADAVFVQRVMSSTTFRIFTSQDTVGVELGGALKNPLALGAGMIDGLGFGINTMSAYVTRSCAELTSLSVAMGGRPETVAGLSGIGDLMLTAFGSLSRNRTCGTRLVKGEKLEDILAHSTVEGVPTAKVAVDFAEMCNLNLPIFRTVAAILNGKQKAEDFVVTSMMQLPLTMETHTGALSEVMQQKPPSPVPSAASSASGEC